MLLAGRRRRPPIASQHLAALPLLFPLASALLPTPGRSQTSLESAVAERALEEIVVTARKIEEDLFDIPMSVAALSGDFIDATDPSTLFELQFDVPGLVVASTGFFGAGIALRGVTDQGGGNLAIAPHLDGVYLGASTLALARLFDVERVEVLKGPQGTLYGRNATGGSINVVTRPPEDAFSAAIESAVGSFETLRARGHVNLPLDEVAIRVAMTASEGDGFIRNSSDDRTFAEQDYIGARVSLLARPGERSSVTIVAQRVEDDGGSHELWLPSKDYLPDPGDVWLTNVTLPNPFLSMTNDFFTVDLTYDMDGTTLESITGYARSITHGLDDCAGSPLLSGCVRGVSPDRHEQWSQELRLRSAADASLDWLLGLYALDSDAATRFRLQRLAPDPINDTYATTQETAYAAFGQATRRLAERWSLTGGLRLSRERARVTSSGTGLRDNPTPLTHDASWDNSSWRIGLEYALGDSGLVYASVATGFKSGGVSIFRLPNGAFDDYEPELLTAYEAGIHLRSPDRPWTLRASAFSYDFEDLQVSTFAILNDEPEFVIDNAAAARIYGVDVSAAVRVNDRLTFSGATVSMPKREFVEYTSAVTGDTLSGNALSRAPEWSAAISVEHRWPLGRVGDFSARLDYDYRSAFFFTVENDPGYAQDAFGLLNLLLRLESATQTWYAFATARNLRDTAYFTQAFLQSSPGYPANYEAGFGWRF